MVCFALNTLLDWLYEKTGCIWVPAIAHGAFNAIAALPQVLVTPADAYYNVLGPMPIGLIAALPMLAAAVWLTLREIETGRKELNPKATATALFVRRLFLRRNGGRKLKTTPETERKTG